MAKLKRIKISFLSFAPVFGLGLIFLFLMLLLACSTKHRIQIPKQPCLYPAYDYDFSLCEDFNFAIDGKAYTIHKGFMTDLASVPKFLWSIYSPTKVKTIGPAVIHDFLYFCPSNLSRREVDSIFYDALILRHMKIGSAFKYWLGVRLFGASHFNTGALCTYVKTGRKDANSYLRMAITTTPRRI